MTTDVESLKLFAVNRALFVADTRFIEGRFDVSIVPPVDVADDTDRDYYPQFPSSLREAAHLMARHYEIFYCLENFIRELVVERLVATYGPDWWSVEDPVTVVPHVVKENVSKNQQREHDAGISPRSTDAIDYTTFGELSNIIDSNWETFGDTFNSRRGLVSVLGRLNLLRGPIAHCSALSEDEVVRLRLTLADWFRLMS